MRRLLTWIVVSLGIAALIRRLRRRSSEDTFAPPVRDDPADELRQKLAESRAEEPAATAEAQPAADAEPEVESRRAEVHEQGRAALDDMREADDST